jgi:TPR repeat protein
MGIVGFVGCLHQRQHGAAQRFSAPDRGSTGPLLEQPRGDLCCRNRDHRPVRDQQSPPAGIEEGLGKTRQALGTRRTVRCCPGALRAIWEIGGTRWPKRPSGLYYAGEGVPLNYIKAYAWYSLAKAQGNEIAADNLDIIKGDMTADQIAEAQRLAAEWWEEHQ